jgi:hypothetical protein
VVQVKTTDEGGQMPLIEVDVPVKILIYGAYGVGKTCFLYSGVEDERIWPVLALDFESGTLSVKSKVRKISIEDLGKIKPVKGKVDVIKITDMKDFDDVLDFLINDNTVYKTVAIDSLTETHNLALRQMADFNSKLSPRRSKFMIELQDYGHTAVQMRQLVRDFRDLPINVIFACLEQEQKNDKTGEVTVLPALTGKIAFEVPALLDIVGNLSTDIREDGELDRVFIFQPTGKIKAKDRSEGGLLGTERLNLTLSGMFDILEGIEDTTTETKETK